MAERSPNFPSIPLNEAIDSVRLIYQREGRSKMPKLSAVKPLGYSSINGRSLGMLGALRAYGLLEGRGDDVRVSDDAIVILNAPENSDERTEALLRAFESPPAFALLRAKGEASPDTLRWHLIKANFRDDAADKLLKVYLASRDFLNPSILAADRSASEDNDPGDLPTNTGRADILLAPLTAGRSGSPSVDDGPAESVHERVLQSGMLSRQTSYKVIVSGRVGPAEIERLLKKLEMDKEILADAEADDHYEDDIK